MTQEQLNKPVNLGALQAATRKTKEKVEEKITEVEQKYNDLEQKQVELTQKVEEAKDEVKEEGDRQVSRIATEIDPKIEAISSECETLRKENAEQSNRITNLEYENRITKAVLAKKIAEESEATGSVIPFPSTGEDGYPLAEWGLLKRLNGKTWVWSQYIHDANFEDEAKWYRRYGNFVFLGNGKLRVMGAENNKTPFIRPISEYMSIKASQNGHKFYAYLEIDTFVDITSVAVGINSGDSATQGYATVMTQSGHNVLDGIFTFTKTLTSDVYNPYIQFSTSNVYSSSVTMAEIEKPRLIDLTVLGLGDVTSVSDPRLDGVKALATAHPEYTAGTLLDSVYESGVSAGRNLIEYKSGDSFSVSGITFTKLADGGVHIKGTATSTASYEFFAMDTRLKGKYYISLIGATNAKIAVQFFNGNTFVSAPLGGASAKGAFDNSNGYVVTLYIRIASGTTIDETIYPMLVEGDVEPTTYTPYVAPSTLDLSFLNSVEDIGIEGTEIDFEKRTVAWDYGVKKIKDTDWTVEAIDVGYRYTSTISDMLASPSRSIEFINDGGYRSQIGGGYLSEDRLVYNLSPTTVAIHESREDNPTSFVRTFGDVKLVYPLSTPITKTFDELGITIPPSWDGGKPWIRVEAGGKFSVVSSGAEAEATVSFVTDLRRA